MGNCNGCKSCGTHEVLLAIDVGNSSMTMGFFQCGQLFLKTAIPLKECRKYFKRTVSAVKKKIPLGLSAVIASVVPEMDGFVGSSLKSLGIKHKFLTYKNIEISIKCKNSSLIGIDRLINAFAASAIYKKDAIIVDCGTATTFDIVLAKGEYLGGAIAPGVKTGMQSLGKKCSKLFEAEIKLPKLIVGKNTKEAIQSGVVYGHIAMITGMVDRIKSEINFKPVIIGTGGFIDLISKGTIMFDAVDPDLTLKGIGLAAMKGK